MANLSTHILDTTRGRPAQGVTVSLDQRQGEGWKRLAESKTNADGRVAGFFVDGESLSAGVYQLTFDTGSYFEGQESSGFYPEVKICFEVTAPDEHHHVPLLLNPFGYSTYRGS